jgi:hypothetical protein
MIVKSKDTEKAEKTASGYFIFSVRSRPPMQVKGVFLQGAALFGKLFQYIYLGAVFTASNRDIIAGSALILAIIRELIKPATPAMIKVFVQIIAMSIVFFWTSWQSFSCLITISSI